MQARKDSADVRVRGERPLHQVKGDISATADTTGTGGAAQNLWYVGLLIIVEDNSL